MTYPKTESWRDDFELDGVHPIMASAIHQMHIWHAADVANRRAGVWPFPVAPIPPDRKAPPPRHADPEGAPL